MYLFQIWTAFRVFDKNGDGMVTKAEFRSVSSNSIFGGQGEIFEGLEDY